MNESQNSTAGTAATDLIIVGAGIIGLAHAYEAHRKGVHRAHH